MSKLRAFYNEIDAYCCAWLSNLMDAGHITPGVIDDRSIEDIRPDELLGFERVHLFAGIAGWELALKRGGWPADRPVWTGSCPCQPFSAAGQRKGIADERHLWPAFHWLVEECRPGVVFGEQVASSDGYAWLDIVQADMENMGYAFGPVVLPAAGFGAPHGRHRIFFVADSMPAGQPERGPGSGSRSATGSGIASELADARLLPRGRAARPRKTPGRGPQRQSTGCGEPCGLGESFQSRDDGLTQHGDGRDQPGRIDTPAAGSTAAPSAACGMEYTDGTDIDGRPSIGLQPLYEERDERAGTVAIPGGGKREAGGRAGYDCEAHPQPESGLHAGGRGAVNGFWANADFLECRDGVYRPVEPGTFPLATGVPARMGKLRAYGNSINIEPAAAFVCAFVEGQAAVTKAARRPEIRSLE